MARISEKVGDIHMINNIAYSKGSCMTERNHSIDKLKFICSFLIVCIHASFPDSISFYFTPITRIAVPIFFIISGYYWNPKIGKNQVKKIGLLFVYSNFLYFLFGIVRASMHHELIQFFKSIISTKRIVDFIVFNESPFAPHLWYLGAILYVIIIYNCIRNRKIIRGIQLLTPILLVVGISLGNYSKLFFNREFSNTVARNWIFVGIPYFTIGIIIHNHEAFLKDHICKEKAVGSIAVFMILGIVEKTVLCNSQYTRDMYFTTAPLAILVFLFTIFYLNQTDTVTSKIGQKYSTLVYIVHYAIFLILSSFLNRTSLNGVYSYFRPIVVYSVALLTAYCFSWCKRMLNKPLYK